MKQYLFKRTRNRFDCLVFALMGLLIGMGYAAAGLLVAVIGALISGYYED